VHVSSREKNSPHCTMPFHTHQVWSGNNLSRMVWSGSEQTLLKYGGLKSIVNSDRTGLDSRAGCGRVVINPF